MPPRLAPPGISTDAQLSSDMHQLLNHNTQRTDCPEYRFFIHVPSSLHNGQTVYSKSTKRKGVIHDAPPTLDLLQPFGKHQVTVLWEHATNPEPVRASSLDTQCVETEATLSDMCQTYSKRYRHQGTSPSAFVPFRATLDGSLVTIESGTYDIIRELHAHMSSHYDKGNVGEIESPSLIEKQRQVRHYLTERADTESNESKHARVYDANDRRHATVTNRKLFSHTMRNQPWWSQFTNENIVITQRRQNQRKASVKRKSILPIKVPCNAQQPMDFVHHDVIVPHWSTTDIIDTYVRAKAVQLEHSAKTSSRLVRVQCKDAPSKSNEWTVAIPHVHPVETCQDLRRGSAVFVRTNASSNAYGLAHVHAIAESNHTLVCGFVGQPLRTLNVPKECTEAKWTNMFDKAFPQSGLVVRFVADDSQGVGFVRISIECASRSRFSISAKSTASRLLGFEDGREYESKQNIVRGVYTLDAPHAIQPKQHVVREHPILSVKLDSNDGKDMQQLKVEQVVPVRPQYSLERDNYKHMSPYQRFPVSFLTPERPQRGMLLYHEMGAGKSRTAIEMAQRHLEHNYWKHVDDAKTSSKWSGERPPVVLFSPTQEARTHFLKNEVPTWTACWWSRLDDKDHQEEEWVPMQHVYRKVSPESLYVEMREHEMAVQSYLWNGGNAPKDNLYLSIVVDNTNSLYKVLQHIRYGVAKKTLSASAKRKILQYFGCKDDSTVFDIHRRTNDDEYYGRFFKDSFVIIDEMHRLCNSMVNSSQTSNGQVGAFFYRALMEAPQCRIVGLSGTPMQRTAVSFAPLFNVIHGKTKVWTIGFKTGASKQLQEDTYADVRPLASTIWTHHRQPIESNTTTTNLTRNGVVACIQFTAWTTGDVDAMVQKLIAALRKQSLILVQWHEYELFPFAFKQNRSYGKQYVVNTETFAEHFVKNNRLRNPVEFAKRVVGLVSYVSPPKVTMGEDPTLSGSDVYPEYAINICHLAMETSHHAYLQSIYKSKRELNQRQADVEERSGCNVNWGAITDPTILKGKGGLLKLFFKGGADRLNGDALDTAYHQLLTHVHTLALTQDASLCRYLKLDQKLQAFSPKMHQIVQSICAHPQQKAVVYSEFIDGVGNSSADSIRVEHKSCRHYLDAGHVGFSGLGVLGYTLQANGLVRFELTATHVFHDLYKLLNHVDTRTMMRAIGMERMAVVTAERIVTMCMCKHLNITIVPRLLSALATDVEWHQMRLTMRELVKWLSSDTYGAHASWLAHVRTRYGLSKATRMHLGLQSSASTPSKRVSRKQVSRGGRLSRSSTKAPAYARMFVEYGRCLSNPPSSVSKSTKADARDFILRLYNVRSTRELDVLDSSLTLQAQKDVRTILRHTEFGNSYGDLIQTLLASAKVTEAVEFKDVRTMHILEPPQDYRQLEQMFGRVIRRGSHPGVRVQDRHVTIKLYVMTQPYELKNVTSDDDQVGAATRQFQTKDEQYWEGVIRRKYEISQDFYAIMKHTAVDCRANLVLNTCSEQDKHLTCYQYPFQETDKGWHDAEAPMYRPSDFEDELKHVRTGVQGVKVRKAIRRKV